MFIYYLLFYYFIYNATKEQRNNSICQISNVIFITNYYKFIINYQISYYNYSRIAYSLINFSYDHKLLFRVMINKPITTICNPFVMEIIICKYFKYIIFICCLVKFLHITFTEQINQYAKFWLNAIQMKKIFVSVPNSFLTWVLQ